MSTSWETGLENAAKLIWGSRRFVKVLLTGGTTSTAVSTLLTYSSADTHAYDGVSVFVMDTTDDAAPKGETSRVTSGGFTGSSGTLTLSPSVTAPESGDTILLMYNGIGYLELLDSYNRVLTAHYWPRYIAAGLVTDGDMETSGVTNWTAVAGATRTKTTTAGQVYTGTAALSVAVTASGDGVQSASVPVNGGFETLYVSVLVKLSDATKSAVVHLYDVTNSASLQSATVSGSDWTEVRFPYAPGSTTENVAVRVLSSATGSWSIYVDYAQILSNHSRFIAIPSQVQHAPYQDGLWYPESTASLGTLLYDPDDWRLCEWLSGHNWEDYFGLNTQRVEIERPQYPLFWRFRQKDSELSVGTAALYRTGATFYADEETIRYGVAADVARLIAEKMSGRYRSEWDARAHDWRARYLAVADSLGIVRPKPVGGIKGVVVP